jgi:hypothetical protein
MLRVCVAFSSTRSADARRVRGRRGACKTALFAAIATEFDCLSALGAGNINWSKCYG